MTSTRALAALCATALLTPVLASCSVVGESDSSPATTSTGKIKDVVLVTHDSFVLPKPVVRDFESQTGYHLVVKASGDGGTLTNKLVLTKDDPTGDVSFGVDNTFASRALDEGVFAPYSFSEPAGVSDYALPGDDQHALTPVDNGNVCVNVDDTWFKAHHVPEPTTLDDLTDPAYRNLFVLPGAATSSTGMAFLLTTVAKYGDAWPDYWKKLMANGAELTSGWSDAYEVDFTQGGGKGDRPIVLSYDSSPAFTVPKGSDTSTTHALLDTCFRQVEYVGVLHGATNVPGAEAFVRFMTSDEVQRALPESMYVFPVVTGTPLPSDWAHFATQPTAPYAVDPAEVASHRDEWLREWSDVTSQ
ncbi:MAG: thiamine ABC transporter substrate-binding protein [Nocardioides sp.]